MSINKNIVLVSLISIVFGGFNFMVFMLSSKPTIIQGFISVAFVIMWFLYGFLMTYKKMKNCFRFITLYWSIGVALTLIAFGLNLYVLSIPLSCIFVTPLYGLRYFFKEPIDSNFLNYAMFITYLFAVLGCFLGKTVKPTSYNVSSM